MSPMNTFASPGRRHEVGSFFPPLELRAIDGSTVPVPASDGALLHLQFRRYAGCPICHLHLRSIARRHDEIVAAGVREVVVFHSTREELLAVHRQPFAVVADPERNLYRRFGVEASPRSMLDPRAWPAALRALATRASRNPVAGVGGGALGLPADFLFGGDGRIVAAKYGEHADDQWSVDEILSLARSASSDEPLRT